MTRNRESDPKHIEVMLLGTFHMDLLWLADTDIESDDMLTAGRQAELRDLTATSKRGTRIGSPSNGPTTRSKP